MDALNSDGSPQELELEHIVGALYQVPVNLDLLRPVSSVTVVPLNSVNQGVNLFEAGKSEESRDEQTLVSHIEIFTKKSEPTVDYSFDQNSRKQVSEHIPEVALATRIKRRFEQTLNHNIMLDNTSEIGSSTLSNKQPRLELVDVVRYPKSKPVAQSTSSIQSRCKLQCNQVKTTATMNSGRKLCNNIINLRSEAERLPSLPLHSDPEKSTEYTLVACGNLEYALLPSSTVIQDEMGVASGDDFDEMWQLPNDICRICAKRSDSIEHMFSEKSENSRIVEMIHNHLPIKVVPEDVLPLTVCQTCLSGLRAADKLVKTCAAADSALHILLEHVCQVKLPANMCKVDHSVEKRTEDLAFISEDNLQSPQKSDCGIKSEGFTIPFVKLPKSVSASKLTDHSKVKEILKTLKAHLTFVKTGKERKLSVIAPILVNPIASQHISSQTDNSFESNVEQMDSGTFIAIPSGGSDFDGDHCIDSEDRNIQSWGNISEASDSATSEPEEGENSLSPSAEAERPRLLLKSKFDVNSAQFRKLARRKEKRQLAKLKCSDCDFAGSTKDEVAEHKLIHLKCKYCDKPHKSRTNLTEHERIHTKEKPFICDQCGLRYRTKSQMKQHAQRHNLEAPYKCEICGRSFSVKNTYTAHLLRHNAESPYLCETCGKSFKLKAALRFHKLSHRTYKCSFCGESFSYRKLQVHKMIHTGEGYFTCSQCDKKFTSRTRLKNHQVIHEGVFPFNCGVCHRSFKRVTHLQAHRERHAGSLLLGILFYRCAVCEESFDNASTLSRHAQNHSDEERLKTKAFKCSSCDKCFSEEQELQSHELRHNSNPLYSCSTCNQSFSQQEDLNKHSSDHFEDKPLACEICGKRFGALLNLNNHKAIHLSIKPYSCEVCVKSFKTLNGLNQHKIAHSDVRKFSCVTCSLSFKRRDALKNHERTHFTERPYTCSVCARSFKSKSDCATHVRRHRLSGIEGGSVIESVHKCPACPQTFALKVDLANHVHTSHPQEVPLASLRGDDFLLSGDVNACSETEAF